MNWIKKITKKTSVANITKCSKQAILYAGCVAIVVALSNACSTQVIVFGDSQNTKTQKQNNPPRFRKRFESHIASSKKAVPPIDPVEICGSAENIESIELKTSFLDWLTSYATFGLVSSWIGKVYCKSENPNLPPKIVEGLIPTGLVPTEPAPTEPVPTESVPTEPVSTEPVSTEPVSTEPVSTEPVPTKGK